MKFNYHTHTFRCNHAETDDEAYVLAAIRRGFTTLGFADHAPYVLPAEWNSWYRMEPEQIEGYVTSLLSLREKYKDRIDIKIGFETELYPDYFDDLLDRIRPYPIDYFILGQHYIPDESRDENYSGREMDISRFDAYIRTLLTAISCGRFSYIAHPDIFCFKGDEEIYRDRVTKLCLAAKEANIPLEINMPGLARPRRYPTERFFRIAGEVGAPVIFGCDAHNPSEISEAPIKEAYAFAERCGVTPVDHLTLRNPFTKETDDE